MRRAASSVPSQTMTMPDIKPYRHWLKDGKHSRFDDMVFTKPFLPIYGNHDYYDFKKAIPGLGGFLAKVSKEIGAGSKNGRVFEQAFVEKDTSRVQDGCLPYVTGERTRIPNRYYWFTHGPCAFFALDSNTLDGVENPSGEQRDDLDRRPPTRRS